MIPAILCCLLVCQGTPSDDNRAGLSELSFVEAVEDFVRLSRPAARPPEPSRGHMARMASPAWRERDRATREAEAYVAANPDSLRWLFWGRRSRDQEVAVRCNGAIRRLHPCPACGGVGTSTNWPEWACSDCAGSGTLWPLSAWD